MGFYADFGAINAEGKFNYMIILQKPIKKAAKAGNENDYMKNLDASFAGMTT
jgi:hypothetical protein